MYKLCRAVALQEQGLILLAYSIFASLPLLKCN